MRFQNFHVQKSEIIPVGESVAASWTVEITPVQRSVTWSLMPPTQFSMVTTVRSVRRAARSPAPRAVLTAAPPWSVTPAPALLVNRCCAWGATVRSVCSMSSVMTGSRTRRNASPYSRVGESVQSWCLVAIHVVLCAILGNVLTLGNVRKRCQSVVNVAARKRTSCVKRSRAGRSWNVMTYVSKKRNARKSQKKRRRN